MISRTTSNTAVVHKTSAGVEYSGSSDVTP